MESQMRALHTATLLMGVFAATACAWAQTDTPLTITYGANARSLHMPIGKSDVTIAPAVEDYAFMLFDVCDAMKLPKEDCNIFPMNGDLGGNAIATIYDGNQLIVYDRTLSSKIGYGGAMTVVAHEVAHLFCHHLTRPPGPQLELEADRFAGAAIRLAGYALEDALAVVPILDERPSVSHPGRAERVGALTSGWKRPERAKDCRRQ